ncbi:MAG TPA: ATP-binding cassette domain-containing protein [Symbiobacteriaceae bacterium]|nr:ATP-binding cassette domain-containing protein [Symbiobacteriaceae bacterium]
MIALIQLTHLTCRPIFHDITFTVGPGEIVALVGSQGSGKSTLLRVLAGVQAPSGGTASVAGIDCGSPEVKRVVGVTGAAWGYFPRLTVRENLRFFGDMWGVPATRVADMLKLTDLTSAADTQVQKLRPGEVARLGLARALLHDPPVLLLDEPIGDVDRESASLITFTLGEAAERGKTVLVATFGHNQTIGMAGRLLYLEGGRLLVPESERSEAQRPEQAPIRHIAARRDERVLLFAPADIRYAYAQEKIVYIQTADGPFAVSFTLSELEERLADQGFFRCHRAFLVNVAQVREIAAWTRDSYSLILKDGRDVPLSKHRAQALKELLGW